ncbi:hypothetical protein L208DRAFT_1391250 [Tricholoma matsutake]|nr:hypothetical protein L208DRAFT_1391250 [Tricholoma matsutake 945]
MTLLSIFKRLCIPGPLLPTDLTDTTVRVSLFHLPGYAPGIVISGVLFVLNLMIYSR